MFLALEVDGAGAHPDAIVERLVPELQERGVHRTAYEGTTLRDHLALPSIVRSGS